MSKIFIIIVFLLSSLLACSQDILNASGKLMIRGRVFDSKTKESKAYASIYNETLQKGTISNREGYFQLVINDLNDRVIISFIGYKTVSIKTIAGKNFYEIYLEENVQMLKVVSVTASDNSYLFDLIIDCKKNNTQSERSAKAYYELKSSVNNEVVEIVENFYNVDIKGYDIKEINLKTGRFGLQFYKNRIFVSMESSRAITDLKLFEFNNLFPISPFQLSKRRMKKNFYIELKNKYQNDNLDSIYMLKLTPKDSTGLFFNGKIWIDPLKKNIVKIKLSCFNVETHPFVPLFYTDSIKKVDLNIVKSFKEIQGEAFFQHIDFNYKVSYKNRQGDTYDVSTNAIIHAYDFDNVFSLPKFEFSDNKIGDYRKINAIPYNAFFWENNDELKLSHENNGNEKFMNQSETITNKTLFSANRYFKRGFLEHPYIAWTGKRVLFRDVVVLDKELTSSIYLSEQYNLSVKIFLDINSYSDTVNILTSTIIDPYESFYSLPINKATNCFINVYFDLIEIERRNLVKEIQKTDRDKEAVEKLYNNCIEKIEKLKKRYLKETERGTNEKKMISWSKYVADKLAIDNIEIFKPYDNN